MYHIFKNSQFKQVTASNLPQVIRTFTGVPLKDVEKGELLVPPTFKLHNQQGRTSIRKDYQFLDYKEAFVFLKFIASNFDRLNYAPKIFNVYNRVVVEFSDPDSNGPTTKEAFMARYLFELENNPLHAAQKTLQDLNSEYVI